MSRVGGYVWGMGISRMDMSRGEHVWEVGSLLLGQAQQDTVGKWAVCILLQ